MENECLNRIYADLFKPRPGSSVGVWSLYSTINHVRRESAQEKLIVCLEGDTCDFMVQRPVQSVRHFLSLHPGHSHRVHHGHEQQAKLWIEGKMFFLIVTQLVPVSFFLFFSKLTLLNSSFRMDKSGQHLALVLLNQLSFPYHTTAGGSPSFHSFVAQRCDSGLKLWWTLQQSEPWIIFLHYIWEALTSTLSTACQLPDGCF